MLKVPGAKGHTPSQGHHLDIFINKISGKSDSKFIFVYLDYQEIENRDMYLHREM